jgi:ankyrin repeat protein
VSHGSRTTPTRGVDGGLWAKVLLDSGADVNLEDAKGYTALMHAAVNGELSALKFLLDNGVDVDQRNANGLTALMRASSRGEMESVRFLLSNGADVNTLNKFGYTALYRACIGPIRDLLRAHGAVSIPGTHAP